MANNTNRNFQGSPNGWREAKLGQDNSTKPIARRSGPAPIFASRKRRQRYKGRLFAVKNNQTRSFNAESAIHFDYEQKYPEDPYGEETFPEARVWKIYNEEAGIHDVERIEAWRDALDVLLVFLGLFSAIVTTFVVQTLQALQPDYAQVSAALNWEILHAIVNSSSYASIPASITINAHDPREAIATPTRGDILVNTLWFTSLAISLSTGLLTVLVKQWLYHYTRSVSGSSRERARIRQFRIDGLKRYRVAMIIDILPLALASALALFLAGLAILLSSLHHLMFWIVVTITGFSYGLYFISVILPSLDPQCPYHSPITPYFYSFTHLAANVGLRFSRLVYTRPTRFPHHGAHDDDTQDPETLSLPSLAEKESHVISRQSTQLDANSLVWLYTTSSNSTAQGIALEAFGGLPPGKTDTSGISKILQSDLYSAIRRCSVPEDPHPIPLPGFERKHDRLLRALCVSEEARSHAPFDFYMRGMQEGEVDPRRVYGLRVLPWLEGGWQHAGHSLEAFFLPSAQSNLRFPLPVWATLIRLAMRHMPEHQMITVGMLCTLSRLTNEADKGAVDLEAAIQDPTVQRLALWYLGIEDATASNILPIFHVTILQILSASNVGAPKVVASIPPAVDAFLSLLFKSLARLTRHCTLSLKDTELMQRVIENFLMSPHMDRVSWETFSRVLETSNQGAPTSIRAITSPTMIRRTLEMFTSGKVTHSPDMHWVERAVDHFRPIVMACLTPNSPDLAEAICITLRELDMLRLGEESMDEDGSCLPMFWSMRMCRRVIEKTNGLQLYHGGHAWLEEWLSYIHTHDRLVFLCRRMLPMRVQSDFWDPLSHLSRLRPQSTHWPSCLRVLISLFRDTAYLDGMVDEDGIQIKDPRNVLKRRLAMLKSSLERCHDLSDSIYDIPSLDHNGNLISNDTGGLVSYPT